MRRVSRAQVAFATFGRSTGKDREFVVVRLRSAFRKGRRTVKHSSDAFGSQALALVSAVVRPAVVTLSSPPLPKCLETDGKATRHSSVPRKALKKARCRKNKKARMLTIVQQHLEAQSILDTTSTAYQDIDAAFSLSCWRHLRLLFLLVLRLLERVSWHRMTARSPQSPATLSP